MENKNAIVDAFKWLFIGLLVCFLTAYTGSQFVEQIYNAFSGLGWIILLISELVICFVLTLGIRKLSPTTAKILYLLYTALTGLALNGIFLLYTDSSIAFVFLITSLLFGIFAIIGKNTKIDLTKFGIYLFVALLAIIILEIINLFLKNIQLDMTLCIITIVVFLGYVSYDVNRLVKSNYLDDTENKGIYFAFQLFIDFIDIFIKLLRIIGKERD